MAAADLFLKFALDSDDAVREAAAFEDKLSKAVGGGFADGDKAAASFTDNLERAQPAGQALLGVGAGVAAGLGFAVNEAANFEKSISGIGAVAGATEAEMAAIREEALRIGSDTAFSASEASAGMEELIKGGLTVQDVLHGGADAALALAAAGGVEVADAGTIMSDAFGIFNLEGKDAANVANQIAGAANSSAISVSDFGYSMAASGSVAAGMGIGFDSLATAIAVMGQNGLKGSDAGTSLKTMLNSLIPTTDKATGVMRDLGLLTTDAQKAQEFLGLAAGSSEEDILAAAVTWAQQTAVMEGHAMGTEAWAKATEKNFESFQAATQKNLFINDDGSFKDMTQIAGILQTQLGGLTDAERSLALETIFGSDAIRAGNIFVKEGAAGFEAMAGSMAKVSAADVGAERMNNLAGVIDQLKGSVETVAITIGTMLIPYIRQGAEWLIGLVNGFQNLDPAMQQFIVIGALVGGAIAAVVGGLILMAPFLAALPGAFAAIGAIVGTVAGVLSGPLVLAVGAVIAIGALLYTAWQNNWGGIQDKVAAVWEWLQGVFGLLVNWLSTNIPVALQTLSDFWTGTLWPAIQTVGAWIEANLFPIFTALAEVYIAVANKAIEAMTGLWQNVLQPALSAVWSFIQDNLGPIFTWLAETAMPAVSTFLEGTLGPAITWFVSNVLTPLWQSLEKVGGFFSDIGTNISDFATSINSMELPWWLTPGSPTPLETGLWGVLQAAQAVDRMGAPNFMAGMPSGALPTTIAPAGAPASNMGLQINLYQDQQGRMRVETANQTGIQNLRLALNQIAQAG